MAGKLTADDVMSASRLPGLLGFSNYSTANDELQFSINAIDGRERPDIGNEAMAWGNTLEPVILAEAAKRLGISEFDTDIRKAYTHEYLALQCSLDGVGMGLGQTIRTDESKGIYVVGQDEITLDGPGVLEAKLTRVGAEDTPHLARGPIQLQGQMLITGHRWGAVAVLYHGTELRTFLFAPHKQTQDAIAKAVMEFQIKLDTYRASGIIDWYPPQSSKEIDRIFSRATDETVYLEDKMADLAQAIINNKAAIRAAEAGIEEAELMIKDAMGNAARAEVGNLTISWPMRSFKAQPEKLVPAKAAYTVRQSTLQIKEKQ